jgi:hypothetical protein
MGFDSSANLLFTIGADASGAESSLQNFRSLFGSTMDQAKQDMASWVQGVLTGSSTAEEAMAGIGPAIEVSFLAVAAAAATLLTSFVELGRKEAEWAEQIEQGSRATGLTVEQLSGLSFAAQQAGLESDRLNGALARFAQSIVAAEVPTSKQALAFQNLGLTQADVHAGEQDMYGLLLKVMDAFRAHADGTNKASDAAALFRDRQATMIQFLDMGSQGLKLFTQRAQETGNVLSEGAAGSAKQYTLAMNDLKAELSGIAKEIGEKTLPALTVATIQLEGLFSAAKHAVDGSHQLSGSWKDWLPWVAVTNVWSNAQKDAANVYTAAVNRILEAQKALKAPEDKPQLPPVHDPTAAGSESAPKVQQATEDYRQLSNMLEQVKGSLAAATSEEDKIAQHTEALNAKLQEAFEKFADLNREGKITPEVFNREAQALDQLRGVIDRLNQQQIADLVNKRVAAEIAAQQDLTQRIEAQQQDTYQHQINLWTEEIQKLTERMAKEHALSAQNQTLLDQLYQAGLAKREKAASDSFAKELNTLNRDLQQMASAYLTSEQRFAATYQQDMLTYSRAEEEKTKATVVGEAQRNMIHVQFEQLRHAALVRMQTDTQTLRNSQGWQGVFGNVFAQGLRSNETLMQQWAQSANRDLLMVKVAFQDLKQESVDTFNQMAQAEGQAAVQAYVAGESIGQAMRKAASDTISALASQAAVQAIMAAAEGFWDLAIGNFPGAAEAFEAAGLFGIVAGGAAVAARAIAPKQAASGGGAGAATADATSSAAASSNGSGASSSRSGPAVNVYIYGHVFGTGGIDEVASMLNDAVKGRDVRLIATQVKSPTRAIR